MDVGAGMLHQPGPPFPGDPGPVPWLLGGFLQPGQHLCPPYPGCPSEGLETEARTQVNSNFR